MTNSKVTAWILLVLVLGAVIFSVVSMFQGRLKQAMLFTPFLFVLYIFGLGAQKKTDIHPSEDPSGSDNEEQENRSDQER